MVIDYYKLLYRLILITANLILNGKKPECEIDIASLFPPTQDVIKFPDGEKVGRGRNETKRQLGKFPPKVKNFAEVKVVVFFAEK